MDDDLIGRYLLAAAEYADAQSRLDVESELERCNRAADELRRIATVIGKRDTASIRAFSRLLDDSRNGVSGWAAFHVLEVMTAPQDIVDRAFETLDRIAAGEGVMALGTRMRVQELRRQFRRTTSHEPRTTN